LKAFRPKHRLSHVREISLLPGDISNQVRTTQTTHFGSMPGQNPGRSCRGDSVVLPSYRAMVSISNDGEHAVAHE